ncbi:SRPBCC family protein [Flaviaesturariibacter amylovorans]|uniref:SRPBCC family protein n=1 Tax=Flaviaesturariibacter amylovorans TaxID=1084520 RepID=A0ABP8GL27_9BACT
MPRLQDSIHILRPPEAVFDITQDYSRRLEWDTFLVKAELLGGAPRAAVGVRAWCVAHNGLGMETEYVSFRPPRVAAVKMTRGPWLFKDFAGSWNFREAAGGTEVVFVYAYALRFPFVLFGAFARRRLQREVRQRLLDLKAYLEGAEPSGGR